MLFGELTDLYCSVMHNGEGYHTWDISPVHYSEMLKVRRLNAIFDSTLT